MKSYNNTYNLNLLRFSCRFFLRKECEKAQNHRTKKNSNHFQKTSDSETAITLLMVDSCFTESCGIETSLLRLFAEIIYNTWKNTTGRIRSCFRRVSKLFNEFKYEKCRTTSSSAEASFRGGAFQRNNDFNIHTSKIAGQRQ